MQFVSPIAGKIGLYGGDVGNYIVICVVILIYIPTRAYEIKHLRHA